jgi:D-alanyl-lipoteichoic acid acyltransferase DltB (MBOAT superfamily)
MLFNSYVFIFAFLPIALAGYFGLGRIGFVGATKLWLIAASCFFYGWWSVPFLGLLLASIAFNYGCGQAIRHLARAERAPVRLVLALAIVANVSVLAWFKYAGFIVDNLRAVSGLDIAVGAVVLPLAISFYTFQQIAYLIDCARRRVAEHGFVDYALFVTFFPQLIAGPILHHSEMMPQFHRSQHRFRHEDFAAGLAFFVIGLVKKVVLADTVGALVDPVFRSGPGASFGCLEAWIAVLAASVRIYFDFSGYSDMAVGLARMLGIRLPYNFNSPYQATSIIDFWRRWHITLSRFLRDYVYVPLGGNRRGPGRRYLNLMATMLLGGLWHGAGWTFVVWGGLHGLYLLVNHAWQRLQRRLQGTAWAVVRLPRPAGQLLTLAAVLIAWVFFHAAGFEQALAVLGAMAGLNGGEPALHGWVFAELARGGRAAVDMQARLLVLALGIAIALFAPNAQTMIDGRATLRSAGRPAAWLAWRPTAAWAGVLVLAFLFTLTQMANVKAFIYFQF